MQLMTTPPPIIFLWEKVLLLTSWSICLAFACNVFRCTSPLDSASLSIDYARNSISPIGTFQSVGGSGRLLNILHSTSRSSKTQPTILWPHFPLPKRTFIFAILEVWKKMGLFKKFKKLGKKMEKKAKKPFHYVGVNFPLGSAVFGIPPHGKSPKKGQQQAIGGLPACTDKLHTFAPFTGPGPRTLYCVRCGKKKLI